MKCSLFAALPMVCVGFLGLHVAPAQEAKVGPSKAEWDKVVAQAATFLKSSQEANGGWSTSKSPGITGVALAGLLKSGAGSSKDPVGEKALKYIESLVNAEKSTWQGRTPRCNFRTT